MCRAGSTATPPEPLGPSWVRADRLVMLATEKAGLDHPWSQDTLGDYHVGDIGVPPELIEAVARTPRAT